MFSEWNLLRSDAYCDNNEEHSVKLKDVTECQGLCLERDNCIGVSFSQYYVQSGASYYGKSPCYFCRDAVTQTNTVYDTFIKPGNPELIVIKNMLAMLAADNALNPTNEYV